MTPSRPTVSSRPPPGKGANVAPQNQDFYLEEQQKKIEEKFAEAITIARASGISLKNSRTYCP